MSFTGFERWEHLARNVSETDSNVRSAHQSREREAHVIRLVENSPEKFRGVLRERMRNVLAAESAYCYDDTQVFKGDAANENGGETFAANKKSPLIFTPKNEIFVPDNDEKKVHEQIMLGNLPALHKELERRIWQFLMKGKKNIIIGIDGPPGAGKTSNVDASRQIQTKIGNGLDSIVVGMDQFIQFERSQRELRKYLAGNAELFWNLLYSQALMKETLSRIYHANGTPSQIDVPQMYVSGEVKPHTIHVPKEPKLVIVEGVGVTKIVDDFLQESGGSGITVFIRGKFEKNIQRAIGRDVSKGTRTREETIAIQTAQGPHLMELAKKELMPRADIIVVPHLN